LREAFDRSFAQAPSTEATPVEHLLAIRIGADPYALRMSEVAGLFADKKVTPLPSAVSELLGIAGFRGAVRPVYDLGMLLGCQRTGAPRWLVVTAVTSVALAFDGFDGYVRVPSGAIVPDSHADAHDRHVREAVRVVDLVRPLISLASVLEWTRSRTFRDGMDKER
jgi:purine-binding chemotaxis protein CheW